ncbi:MAG TPA: apolipoprotein N-acyltransferase, partial [Gammaproteobacteria bacterium]
MSRLGRRGGDLLAFACGLALPLGFAPFGVWPAPLLALAVALQTWVARGPGVGFRRGWLFGLGAFGFGIGWVHVSMHDYGGASLPLAYAVSLLLAGFLALYPALCAAWVARTWQRDRRVWRVVVVLPAAWVLLEWVRGWLLSGFPWLELGYGQIDTPLAQLAPLGGSLLVTAAAVFSAGLLWALAAALPLGRVLAAALLALLW